MYQIILASESPRRKEIMDTMGIRYKVITSNVEEAVEEKVPEEMVQAIARLKTEEVLKKQQQLYPEHQDVIILGADTMVFYGEHALGKPQDEQDAIRMLSMLSEDSHNVITGVSIIIANRYGFEERISFAVSTKVTVQPLTLEQILDYIATGEPMDKAGAYAIQGKFGIYIKEIAGDYYNIVGFPISKINEVLLQKGIDIKKLK
jgi:septum formation protein